MSFSLWGRKTSKSTRSCISEKRNSAYRHELGACGVDLLSEKEVRLKEKNDASKIMKIQYDHSEMSGSVNKRTPDVISDTALILKSENHKR